MTIKLVHTDSLYTDAPYAYASVAPRGSLIFTALVAVWDVVRAAFGDHDAPSTLLGVTVLGWPDQLVEIEAVAVTAP